jgi:heme exporter protein A
MTAAMLRVENLGCEAGQRTLFAGLTFELRAGRWSMLTGTNGSGKTTLLRAIAGLVRQSSGGVEWNGAPRRVADPQWHSRFLYQGHSSGWKDSLSAAENLASQVSLDLGRPPDSADLARALERSGLARQRDVAFGRLSAGQRRRLGLARLACCSRSLWLLDEPATALDVDAQATLSELLDRHLDAGGCAVIASHQSLTSKHLAERLDLDTHARRAQPSIEGARA